MKVGLTQEQAAILSTLYSAREKANQELVVALRLVGVDPSCITGGEVSGDSPHLIVTEADSDEESKPSD